MSALEQQVPDGFWQSEVGIFPIDWKINSLTEISTKITDGTHDTPTPIKEGIPFLTAIHVKENHIAFESCYFLPKSVHDEIYKRCNPEYEDILMVNIGAGTGTTALVNVKYPFSLKNVALIKPDKKVSDGRFLNQVLSFLKDEILESLSAGGAQPFLSLSQIGQINVPTPSKEEQTAIANALSDFDALLTELEKLIAKKQAIKTATMQQLLTGKTRLPQFAFYSDESAEVATDTEGTLEGKSQGQPKHSSRTNVKVGACEDSSQSTGMDSRRKGTKPTELGEIPEDWDVITFAELKDKNDQWAITGGPFGSNLKSSDYTESGVRIIQLQNIGDGVFKNDDFVFTSIEKADELKSCNIYPNEIILSKMGDPVARACLIPEFHCRYLMCSDGIRLKVDENKHNFKFIFYSLNFPTFRNQALDASTGSTRKRIGLTELKTLLITVPCKEEQTAIATILSDMDNEIQTLERRLAKTRQIKQGMMQELLTGRTRLPFDKG